MKKADNKGLIFEKSFKAPKESDIYKPYMEYGLSDPSLEDFTPIWMMRANKDDERGAKKEWVDSYKEAAKMLSIVNQEHAIGKRIATPNKETNSFLAGAKYTFYSYQLTLPAIFLTRHAAELAIKEAIELAGGKSKDATHNLERLWHSFLARLPEDKIPFDRANIKQMKSYLTILMHLDDDGTKVRYATDKKGNYTHEKYEWVNCALLSKSLDAFIDSLRSVNYEYIQMANKKEGK